MSTKTLSLALFLFTALTLTHAAFVNYRSGAAELQPQYRGDPSKVLLANQMMFLQSRKIAGPQLAVENYANEKRAAWRGMTKNMWTERGLCCGAFELLVSMKGARTRTAILKSLARPKNKLQMAREIGIDWKAVDSHIRRLLAFGLVLEWALVGTCRVYVISEKGRHALELLEQPEYNLQSI
jgi:hypothetical protein